MSRPISLPAPSSVVTDLFFQRSPPISYRVFDWINSVQLHSIFKPWVKLWSQRYNYNRRTLPKILVAPLPVPKIPDSMQPIPSVVIPRLIACRGGGGSEQISAYE